MHVAELVSQDLDIIGVVWCLAVVALDLLILEVHVTFISQDEVASNMGVWGPISCEILIHIRHGRLLLLVCLVEVL